MSHITVHRSQIQDHLRTHVHTRFFYIEMKRSAIHTGQHKPFTGQDEECTNEDLHPVNWIPGTGVSSGSGSDSGSGSGSSG